MVRRRSSSPGGDSKFSDCHRCMPGSPGPLSSGCRGWGRLPGLQQDVREPGQSLASSMAGGASSSTPTCTGTWQVCTFGGSTSNYLLAVRANGFVTLSRVNTVESIFLCADGLMWVSLRYVNVSNILNH
jgi:hypothetical protein